MEGSSAFAAEARIAVAANFRDTAEAIAARLEAESPHRYEVIAGSTGKLASQILNGAPYDVFMAADRQRPQLLVDRGLASARLNRFMPWRARPVVAEWRWHPDP